MFKLVVLFAVLAAAVAEPGALFAAPLIAPLTYSSTVISPASTTISKQASSVVHPSPAYLSYAEPYFSHFIKKRSAPLLAAPYYAAPYLPAPVVTPILRAPLYHAPIATPIAYSPLHLIKKRSAPLLTTPYFSALPYSAPLFNQYSYASPAVLPAAPVIAHTPLAYTHLIKKRSAILPLATTYLAPSAVSHQSRIDIKQSPSFFTTSYSSPLVYSSPIFTHFK